MERKRKTKTAELNRRYGFILHRLNAKIIRKEEKFGLDFGSISKLRFRNQEELEKILTWNTYERERLNKDFLNLDEN